MTLLMTNEPIKKFEDYIDIIETAIRKQRSRWRLDSIAWFDFQDVEQVIKIHIHNKWHMWDQKRPLEPWINIIVANQIRNLVRNHYGNYTKPCLNCEFNMGDVSCSYTASKIQDSQCKLYLNWSKTKKSALDLKITTTTENHEHEIGYSSDKNLQFEKSISKLNLEMKKELSKTHYKAYLMLYFDEASEEDVAKFMGYKTNEKKRKAGYRQVKNLKKMFQQKASEIIQNKDIIVNGIK